MRQLDPEYLIPLSPLAYQILLALAGRPLYGFAIMEECQADSEQVINMRPSTLYPALKRLEQFRYIELLREDPPQGSGHSRRVFGLTHIGRLVLEQETDRLSHAVHLAEHRLRQIDTIQP